MTRIINLMTFPFKYKCYIYVQLNSLFFLACQDNIKGYCEYEHSNDKSNQVQHMILIKVHSVLPCSVFRGDLTDARFVFNVQQ